MVDLKIDVSRDGTCLIYALPVAIERGGAAVISSGSCIGNVWACWVTVLTTGSFCNFMFCICSGPYVLNRAEPRVEQV
jgi:hypothetical protein